MISSDFSFKRGRWPKKRPIWSEKKLRKLSERSFSRSGCERSEFPDESLYLAPSADCQVTPAAQPNLQPVHGFGQVQSHMKFHTSAAAGQKNGQSDRKRNYEKSNPLLGGQVSNDKWRNKEFNNDAWIDWNLNSWLIPVCVSCICIIPEMILWDLIFWHLSIYLKSGIDWF